MEEEAKEEEEVEEEAEEEEGKETKGSASAAGPAFIVQPWIWYKYYILYIYTI